MMKQGCWWTTSLLSDHHPGSVWLNLRCGFSEITVCRPSIERRSAQSMPWPEGVNTQLHHKEEYRETVFRLSSPQNPRHPIAASRKQPRHEPHTCCTSLAALQKALEIGTGNIKDGASESQGEIHSLCAHPNNQDASEFMRSEETQTNGSF